MSVKFDLIRLGTKYENYNNLKPVLGFSNGTLIAFGDSKTNRRFTTFGNNALYKRLQNNKKTRNTF
jgi:hypothetical protein